jgi:hypothetical protein
VFAPAVNRCRADAGTHEMLVAEPRGVMPRICRLLFSDRRRLVLADGYQRLAARDIERRGWSAPTFVWDPGAMPVLRTLR